MLPWRLPDTKTLFRQRQPGNQTGYRLLVFPAAIMTLSLEMKRTMRVVVSTHKVIHTQFKAR